MVEVVVIWQVAWAGAAGVGGSYQMSKAVGDLTFAPVGVCKTWAPAGNCRISLIPFRSGVHGAGLCQPCVCGTTIRAEVVLGDAVFDCK